MEAKFYEPKFKEGKIVAFADIELDSGVTVRGFRVINGANGLFGAPPSKKVTIDGETQYVNQVVFDTQDRRERFMTKLLSDYEAWRQHAGASSGAA